MFSPIRKAWNELRWVIRVSRPRFWIYLFGPYLLGMMAAIRWLGLFEQLTFRARLEQLHTASVELYFGLIQNIPKLIYENPLTFLNLLLAVIAIFGYPLLSANLLLYGINDLFDADTDQFNPKKDLYELRLTSVRKRSLILYIVLSQLPWIFLIIVSCFTFPSGTLYRSLSTLFLFIFLSIGYSMPPIRAKARPFLDSLFNILYLLPGLFAYFLILDGSNYFHPHFPWLPVLAAALWCMAMHAYSAVPDIEADTRAHLETIATKLGARRTLLTCMALYAGSTGLAIASVHTLPFQLILIALGSIYLFMMFLSLRYQQHLFSIYKFFPFVNTFTGIVLFFSLLLV